MNKIILENSEMFPSKVVCIGRNYMEHIKELKNEIPEDMVFFIKPNSAISNKLIFPKNHNSCHYEAEISFLIEDNKISAVAFGLDLTLREIQSKLKAKGISVKYDNRSENKPGWKFAEYEMKGVPIRIAMGARDLENQTVEIARRDNLTKETQPLENIDVYIENLLKTIQEDIYNKALSYREEHITKVDSYDEFKKVLEEKGGFISAHWDGTDEEEEQIKNETKATIRCIPLDNILEEGVSLISGKKSTQRVIFAKAY